MLFSDPATALISSKNISGINLLLHIIQDGVIPVSYNRLTLLLESLQIIHHLATEERTTICQCRLINYHLGTFGLDALHKALNGALAEIIGVGLHGEAVHAYHAMLLSLVKLVILRVSVPACFLQYLVGYIILPSAVALYYGSHHVLRHVSIVGQKLFGVFWQAVTTVTEAWVIIVCTDAWV